MKITEMVDYKFLLKCMGLTLNQKKVLYAFCEEPTDHPYSFDYKLKHKLTSGGITSALKRLQALTLISQDAGVWRLRNQGMQKWLFAVRSSRPVDEVEVLRHGAWAVSQDFMSDRVQPELEKREIFGSWKDREVDSVDIVNTLRKVDERNPRINEVMRRVEEIFKDPGKATLWLNSANRALGGHVPLQLIESEGGITLILDELGRIEHGIPI